MAITEDEIREISDTLTDELRKLGLYVQDVTVGLPPPHAVAHGSQPVVQMVCALGEIAWSPRVQDPASLPDIQAEVVDKAINTRIDAWNAAQELGKFDLDDDDPAEP